LHRLTDNGPPLNEIVAWSKNNGDLKNISMALFDHHFGLVINVIIIKTIIKSGKINNPP